MGQLLRGAELFQPWTISLSSLWSVVVAKVMFVAVSKTGQGFSGIKDVWHIMAVSHMPEHSAPTEDACLPPSCLLETASGTYHFPAVYKRVLGGLDQNCASYAGHKTV